MHRGIDRGTEQRVTAYEGNEDGDSVKAIAEMFGVMALTSFAVLSEHSLFNADSEVKNIGIISLLLLEFIEGPGCDLDCDWGCEIVRLCDDAGIQLDKEIRKQINFSKSSLEDMRESYKEKRERSDFDLALEFDQDGYKAFAQKDDWVPEDDMGEGERLWYRWDWELEVGIFPPTNLHSLQVANHFVQYKTFKKNHKGGTHYDLSKWSKKERMEYKLGFRTRR